MQELSFAPDIRSQGSTFKILKVRPSRFSRVVFRPGQGCPRFDLQDLKGPTFKISKNRLSIREMDPKVRPWRDPRSQPVKGPTFDRSKVPTGQRTGIVTITVAVTVTVPLLSRLPVPLQHSLPLPWRTCHVSMANMPRQHVGQLTSAWRTWRTCILAMVVL